MTRISAIAISLLLMIGLTAEAQAVTSGSIKCVALQGPVGPDTILPSVVYYNPNATGHQNITRVRFFDQTGTSIADVPFNPPQQVLGRGSFVISGITTNNAEGLQIIVNWQQAADAAAPIGRLNLITNNAASGTTSVAQSNCP
jgi:hypothetical protein